MSVARYLWSAFYVKLLPIFKSRCSDKGIRIDGVTGACGNTRDVSKTTMRITD